MSMRGCVVAICAFAVVSDAAELPRDTERPGLRQSISDVLAERGEGTEVLVEGHVQGRRGPHTYVIADATGHMYVRIPDALLRGGLLLTPGVAIRVAGSIVFRPDGGIEIEARRILRAHGQDRSLGTGDVLVR